MWESLISSLEHSLILDGILALVCILAAFVIPLPCRKGEPGRYKEALDTAQLVALITGAIITFLFVQTRAQEQIEEQAQRELGLKVFQMFFDASNTKDAGRSAQVVTIITAYRNHVKLTSDVDAVLAEMSNTLTTQKEIRDKLPPRVLKALQNDKNTEVRNSVGGAPSPPTPSPSPSSQAPPASGTPIIKTVPPSLDSGTITGSGFGNDVGYVYVQPRIRPSAAGNYSEQECLKGDSLLSRSVGPSKFIALDRETIQKWTDTRIDLKLDEKRKKRHLE